MRTPTLTTAILSYTIIAAVIGGTLYIAWVR